MEKEIKNVIDAIYQACQDDLLGNNQDTLNELKNLYNQYGNDYIDYINFGVLQFIDLAVQPYGVKSHIIEHILNGNFIHFVKRYIVKNEGSSCSSDKESFVVARVIQAIQTNTNISLYQTYQGVEQIPQQDWDKQAYWSPKSLKDTDEVIRLFEKWYYF